MAKKTKTPTPENLLTNTIEKKEFKAKVAELKKSKTKEELLKIVSIQPANEELRDFLAARKALDELGVKYSKSFSDEEK